MVKINAQSGTHNWEPSDFTIIQAGFDAGLDEDEIFVRHYLNIPNMDKRKFLKKVKQAMNDQTVSRMKRSKIGLKVANLEIEKIQGALSVKRKAEDDFSATASDNVTKLLTKNPVLTYAMAKSFRLILLVETDDAVNVCLLKTPMNQFKLLAVEENCIRIGYLVKVKDFTPAVFKATRDYSNLVLFETHDNDFIPIDIPTTKSLLANATPTLVETGSCVPNAEGAIKAYTVLKFELKKSLKSELF